jgi:hypothetical protein
VDDLGCPVTAPAGREPLAPLGVWLLGLLGLLAAWLLAAPLLLPGVVVLGGAVLLGSLLVHVARLWLSRYWSSAGPHTSGRPGPADCPAAGSAAGGGAPLDARIAWCCAQRLCRTAGWAESSAGVFIDAELHAIACHPGSPSTFRLIGATVAGRRSAGAA